MIPLANEAAATRSSAANRSRTRPSRETEALCCAGRHRAISIWRMGSARDGVVIRLLSLNGWLGNNTCRCRPCRQSGPLAAAAFARVSSDLWHACTTREAAMNDAAPASGYAEAYAAWRADPEAWWAGVAEGIAWERRWDRVFDPSSGPYGRWFPGAMLNTCFNCVDRHVLAGRGEQAALIWDSPMTGRIETFTYRQMQTRTAKLAGALAALGVDARRPGGDLPADGAGGGDRHAGLRAAGRDPFRGVRRFRRGRTGLAHRRRQAEGDRVGVLRPRAGARGEIQAAARRGDRAVAAQARCLPDPAARCRTRRTGRGARP